MRFQNIMTFYFCKKSCCLTVKKDLLLGEIHDRYTGVGKAVDDKHPLPPIEMPRRYSGVAILWKKDINHIVKQLKDGGSRIQAVLTDSSKPTLLISVCFPTKG